MFVTLPEVIDPTIGAIARQAYDRCYQPDDSFADLCERARFSKDDRGRLLQWLNYAEVLLRKGDGKESDSTIAPLLANKQPAYESLR